MKNEHDETGRSLGNFHHYGTSEEIVYTCDLAGNFTFLNEAGELMFGYSCKEARRMNIAQLVSPELAEQVQKQIAQNVRERVGNVYEIEIIAKDGHVICLEVSAQTIVRDGHLEIKNIAVPSVLRNAPHRREGLRCVDSRFFAEQAMWRSPVRGVIQSESTSGNS